MHSSKLYHLNYCQKNLSFAYSISSIPFMSKPLMELSSHTAQDRKQEDHQLVSQCFKSCQVPAVLITTTPIKSPASTTKITVWPEHQKYHKVFSKVQAYVSYHLTIHTILPLNPAIDVQIPSSTSLYLTLYIYIPVSTVFLLYLKRTLYRQWRT